MRSASSTWAWSASSAGMSAGSAKRTASQPPMEVSLRPWSADDLALLVRLMGDPEMTEHLGGPESEEKIRARLERYIDIEGTGRGKMFVIVAGPDADPAGSIGYWERE